MRPRRIFKSTRIKKPKIDKRAADEEAVRSWWVVAQQLRDPLFALPNPIEKIDYHPNQEYNAASLFTSFIRYTNYEIKYTSFLYVFRRVTGIKTGHNRIHTYLNDSGEPVYRSHRKCYKIIFPATRLTA